MAPVVGVHGIWNFRDTVAADAAAGLDASWATALGRPPGSVAVAYYADRLRIAGQGAADGVEDLDSLDAALGGLPALLLGRWIEGITDADLAAGQGRTGAPIRQLLSWFVQKYGADQGLVTSFVARFISEVALYFGMPARRQDVRARLANTLAQHRPQVLIAHSLGSVVAYETLWATKSLRIDTLITLGSPLGLPDQIFDRLEPRPIDGRGSKPPNVRRWINVADPGDPVAVPPHLTRRFDGVDEDLHIPVGAFLQHNALKYLRTAEVKVRVAAAVQGAART